MTGAQLGVCVVFGLIVYSLGFWRGLNQGYKEAKRHAVDSGRGAK